MRVEFQFEPLPLPGLSAFYRPTFRDERGKFDRMFCVEGLQQILGPRKLVHVNFSRTACQGALRGLHFQRPPFAEMKIVSCIRGAIFDVAVDIRAGSKTFLQWFGTRLDEESGMGLIIPEGFAHGFQALSRDAEIIYCTSAPYDRGSEGGLNALDPALGISWPLPIAQRSPKDEQLPPISSAFMGLQAQLK